MLFNSIEFAIFLPIVFLLYWFVFSTATLRGESTSQEKGEIGCTKQRLWWQNLFILGVSYLFYGWWDWKFLLLIAFTTLCSFGSGLLIARMSHKRTARFWLWANILLNLGILGLFKYYDFFVSSFAALFGIDASQHLLHLVLPVGISFYTFQALSYSIDVYRGKLSATRDIVAFGAFLSFFPQLVAGPIERADNLLPQFQRPRVFNYQHAVEGMRQIVWGLFKKVVIADNCATYVDMVFGSPDRFAGSTLAVAAVLFAFQIYGDFSGYSDIAIGTAKLFGIQLMRNFNVPYFSRDIAEFWRRWHISLTTWFRDYVYIPLGGSRPTIPMHIHHPEAYKKSIIIRNTFIIFLLSGFWHGANWTFVVWGTYHALLFLPLILLGKNRKYLDVAAWKDLPKILITFILVVLGWIIFRADSIEDAGAFIQKIFSSSLLTIPHIIDKEWCIPMLVSLLVLIGKEWIGRANGGMLHPSQLPRWRIARWALYTLLVVWIYLFGKFDYTQFIYFQF